jgi:hypothetical protein
MAKVLLWYFNLATNLVTEKFADDAQSTSLFRLVGELLLVLQHGLGSSLSRPCPLFPLLDQTREEIKAICNKQWFIERKQLRIDLLLN